MTEILPFKIAVPDEVLADLRERLARTRLPDEVPDTGWEYGTNLRYLRELIEYWRTRYDWRAHERELNRFAHFRAEVPGPAGSEGLKIHFIHEPGRGPNPKPLMLVHGWPGSVYEFDRIIPMLTDPAAHGGDAADSFTVIAPSLPGYGFSDHPAARAMNIQAVADIFFKLMTDVLGYSRFAAQGGDWGSAIVSRLGEVYASSLYGIHLNMVIAAPARGREAGELSAAEKAFLAEVEKWRREETGYQWIQGTKPQTLAYGLNDSPAGLAAWIVEKFRSWSDCGGDLERRFTKDQLLTNVTIYWVTQTINSFDPVLLRSATSSVAAQGRRQDRGADRGRDVSRRDDPAAARMGRACVQHQAMDRDAVGRPFRRDGRACRSGRRYPGLLSRSEVSFTRRSARAN